jgi:putative holliday junction resolvase
MSGTFIGFDFGLRRIGVALGSADTGGARPLRTVANHDSGPEWRAIESLVTEWAPAALVVGVPYNADGSSHEVTNAALAFAAELESRLGLPVHQVDERLTSYAANEALVERRQRGDHRKLRSGDTDSAAAAMILDDWLASRGTNRGMDTNE